MLIHVAPNVVWSTVGYSVSSVCNCSLRYRDRNGAVTVQILDGISTNIVYAASLRRTTKRCYNCDVPDSEIPIILERILTGYEALSGKPCQVVSDRPPESENSAELNNKASRFHNSHLVF